jgi:hypothetical protein
MVKKVIEKNPAEDKFYVGIREPNLFRKELLSATKNIIILLKNIESIRNRRKRKEEYSGLLSKKIKEINFLSSRLNTLLPENKLRAIPGYVNIGITPKIVEKKKEDLKIVKNVKEHHLSELEKLERELQLIENKMKRI